ncbi:MAG: hypothetical protein AUK47_01660 [Deltaproteobacteria bacterium CG2_30_63_29]|nr:MAG: hypothetical protein AUK47_01660 [Deltaproteobacteria bacterium CG2_30_63_29]PJB34200.1 MAG: hypothetical protein CO108_28995 [Deltaproteobacteria bacterium CG_4_9_14_3_um_filter_63_12]
MTHPYRIVARILRATLRVDSTLCPPWPRALGAFGLVALLVVLFGGCGDNFDPKSKVNKLRILAIKAENPRLSAGEFTTFEALVVTADDGPVDLLWEFCPFTGGAEGRFPCVYPEGTPQELITMLQGHSETFAFAYVPELQALVDLFCEQQAQLASELPPGIPLPNCDQGYPARVRLTATEVETGAVVEAVKTLQLVPSSGGVQDNANPAVVQLVPGEDAPEFATKGEAFPLRCELDPTSLESFVRVDQTEVRKEELLISWFVRNGKLEKDLTFYSEDEDLTKEPQENKVTPSESGVTTVWCVVRDGRGGTDWTHLDVVSN